MGESEYRAQLELLRNGADMDGALTDDMLLILKDIAATGVYIHPWNLLARLFRAQIGAAVQQLLDKDKDASSQSKSGDDPQLKSRTTGLNSGDSRLIELQEQLMDFTE